MRNGSPVEPIIPVFKKEEIPSHWDLVPIGDICASVGKVNPKGNPMDGFKYIDISGIDNERFVVAETKAYYGNNAPSRARQLVREGDVVFSTVRTYMKNMARITRELDGQIASTGFCVLRPKEPEYGGYLYYYLQYEPFLNELAKFQRGTSYPAVRDGDVFAQFIPAPPKHDAVRIVAEIEKQFSRLDEAVANLKRVKANLKRYKAAVLKAAVEGKLTEEWRKAHPAVDLATVLLKRTLAGRRRKWEEAELAKMKVKGKQPKDDSWTTKYSEPSAIDNADLAGLPKSWTWSTIGQVTECLDSMRVPVNKKERSTRQGSIPYYGANGQVGWIDDFIYNEPLVLVVEDETFTGREIPFSYKITGKSWVNNHAHVLRNMDAVDLEYLNYSLMYYPFTALTTGTTGRKKLTQGALLEAAYRLPPYNEQIEIVKQIETYLSISEEIRNSVDVNIRRAERLRQAILSRAFSGHYC